MTLEPVQFLFSENTILYFQSLGSPFLDILFKFITDIGSEPIYIFSASLIFWCFSKKTGIKIMYVILFSAFVAIFAKNLFSMSRPPEYLHKIEENGFGFPSGHAQVSSGFWGYLGSKIRNPWLIFAGVAAVLSVSVSRIYLGVHYVGDVAGGILFGISLAFISFKTESGIIDGLQRLNSRSRYFIAVIIPLILIAAASMQRSLLKEQIEIGIVMAGIGTGYLLEEEYIRLVDTKNNKQRIKRAFAGISLLAIVYLISSLMFSELIFLKYLALGFASTFIAPWVFIRMLN